MQKILFVDDEPYVLDGYRRALRKDFEITTADSGEQALSLFSTAGPFAVVVSDMRMPGLDGIQFLARVKQIAPECVRMMLTGNADQQTAIDAVNRGSIFRFLNKPCPPENMAAALNDGLEQHRLITAEKHLLEQTLNKSLHVLMDILAIVNPTAFSRSTRIKKLARDIADRMGIAKAWEVEIAAMLCQIGCVTVPEEILVKLAKGAVLTDKETGLFHQHPRVGHNLIAQIPRLQTVAEMIKKQNDHFEEDSLLDLGHNVTPAVLGGRIIRVVLDYDRLISSEILPRSAWARLAEKRGFYDPQILEVLRNIIDVTTEKFVEVELSVDELEPGMMLDAPLRSLRGSTLLSAGQEVTTSLILRLINLAETGIISRRLMVSVPVARTQAAQVSV